MNCILIKFISSLIKTFTGNWVIFGIRVLIFIVKIIPNHTVCRTAKKKLRFVFYQSGSAKRDYPS